ncbi:uncharacterized protein LOC143283895 [Babylonia areolata]|uniref:uncharacterized protein LOC143283895 n=1 Tax=Babylonia areolata TaxID=304850 RepID=UPI003FD62672
MAAKFKVGDLVWAKVKGFSTWPGKIDEPKQEVKRPSKKTPHHFVVFYGSGDYAWVAEESIAPYAKLRDKYLENTRLTRPFKEALESIESAWQDLPESARKVDLSVYDEISQTPLARSGKADRKQGRSGAKKQAVTSSQKKKLGTPTSRKGIPKKRVIPLQGAGGDLTPSKKPKFSASQTGTASGRSTEEAAEYMNDALEARLPLDDSQVPLEDNQAFPGTDKTSSGMYEKLENQAVIPTPLRIGFLGLGIMGQGMVMNLLRSGHEVTVWNRTVTKTKEFSKAGAFRGISPADVVQSCDITLCCVSDSMAVRDVVFGKEGVLEGITPGKCYVEMSTVDEETVQDVADAVMGKGGTFLEAPVCGSRVPALEGQLIILTAGDRKLHDDCFSCFAAMGKKAFYLSNEVGTAIRMKLIYNMLLGSVTASLAEGMALAQKVGLDQEDLYEVLNLGTLKCPELNVKGQAMMNGRFDPHFPLQHQQKDLRLVLSMGDSVEQPLYIAAAANELYKKARQLGAAEEDVSAVYKATAS